MTFQQTFTCSKSTRKTLEVDVILMSLFLPLNIIHTLFESLLLTLNRKIFIWIASSDYDTVSIYTDFFQTINRCCQVHVQATLFNRDINCGCLVYMFSLRFSGSKFLMNLRQQFRVRKSFSCTKNFSCTSFCGICSLFILCLKLLFRKYA